MAADLATQWTTTPQVEAAFRTKAAIAPGTVTDATFAAPLAQFGIAQEALSLLRGRSIIGALESSMRRVPFRVKVARETTGATGNWIGEGLSTPVSALAYDTIQQDVYKGQVIVVLTDELVRMSSPAASVTVADAIVGALGAFLDSQFLTSSVAATTANPAAITNGATEITTTGSTATAIGNDLASLVAAITTPGDSLRWIMRPKTLAKVASALGSAAADVPRTLLGIPVIVSANSPAQIALVDASSILYSSEESGFAVEWATEGSLQMDSAPTDPAVAATVFTSLWQRDLSAVRVTAWVAWLRARTGSVAFMTVAY